uniref:tRNA wybutosine-synthesizing protein 3 homolog n=1 Tax=Amphiprion percula TaxID=161767 RepID=A0A3P8SLC7_AMPPE
VAVNSGFRNSGITVGKTGKTIAVRSTHGLEVPLSHQGKLLVEREYVDFLTQIANQKMEENLRRIQSPVHRETTKTTNPRSSRKRRQEGIRCV